MHRYLVVAALAALFAALPQAASAAKFKYGVSSAEVRSEEHTSELQSRPHLVCRLLLEKKNCSRSRVYESSVERARWSAALTDCGVVSRIAAASSVWKPITSHSTSAARCFPGSCHSATINESWIASRCS